jgi:hypothetical protein
MYKLATTTDQPTFRYEIFNILASYSTFSTPCCATHQSTGKICSHMHRHHSPNIISITCRSDIVMQLKACVKTTGNIRPHFLKAVRPKNWWQQNYLNWKNYIHLLFKTSETRNSQHHFSDEKYWCRLFGSPPSLKTKVKIQHMKGSPSRKRWLPVIQSQGVVD